MKNIIERASYKTVQKAMRDSMKSRITAVDSLRMAYSNNTVDNTTDRFDRSLRTRITAVDSLRMAD